MIRKTIMPDRDVKTIQDLIYYQYAKIIARRAFGVTRPLGRFVRELLLHIRLVKGQLNASFGGSLYFAPAALDSFYFFNLLGSANQALRDFR